MELTLALRCHFCRLPQNYELRALKGACYPVTGLITPRLIAIAIASVRPMASSFVRIDFTWAFTVFSLIYRICPISLLLRPFAIYFLTCPPHPDPPQSPH